MIYLTLTIFIIVLLIGFVVAMIVGKKLKKDGQFDPDVRAKGKRATKNAVDMICFAVALVAIFGGSFAYDYLQDTGSAYFIESLFTDTDSESDDSELDASDSGYLYYDVDGNSYDTLSEVPFYTSDGVAYYSYTDENDNPVYINMDTEEVLENPLFDSDGYLLDYEDKDSLTANDDGTVFTDADGNTYYSYIFWSDEGELLTPNDIAYDDYGYESDTASSEDEGDTAEVDEDIIYYDRDGNAYDDIEELPYYDSEGNAYYWSLSEDEMSNVYTCTETDTQLTDPVFDSNGYIVNISADDLEGDDVGNYLDEDGTMYFFDVAWDENGTLALYGSDEYETLIGTYTTDDDSEIVVE